MFISMVISRRSRLAGLEIKLRLARGQRLYVGARSTVYDRRYSRQRSAKAHIHGMTKDKINHLKSDPLMKFTAAITPIEAQPASATTIALPRCRSLKAVTAK